MDNQPILSLCIPTNGAVEWVLPVIESIYAQGYDNKKFEVVITDNGKDSQLPTHIAKMNYPNLRYKQTTDEGFLNLVSSLKEGRGLFCKMINHRSIMQPNSIANIVELIDKYKETKPIIYFSCGNIKTEEELVCGNLDEFLNVLSYIASWSGGIGFWRKDIPTFDELELNKMFPNATLLFEVRKDSRYVIWDYRYMKLEEDTGKGGYDLFKTFGVDFIDIINELRIKGRISLETFLKIKNDLFIFLRLSYFNEVVMHSKHTFVIDNICKSMSVYYSVYDYYIMVIKSLLKVPLHYLRKIINANN